MKKLAVFIISFLGILVIANGAYADVVGQQQSFFVNPLYDNSGVSEVHATLLALGQHAYFYVDDRFWLSMDYGNQQLFSSALNGLVSEFDAVIYPKSTQFWGEENIPGNDHDNHVFVLFEWLNDGSGGYFQTINNYNRDVAPDSNVHEMIYIDANSVLRGLAKNFIAHELQHLISFNQKEIRRNVRDTVWLNEGRSEYNEMVVGYDSPFNGSMLQQRAREFLLHPSDSLVEWPNTSTDYGIVAVFMQYVADQYGPSTVASTIRTATAGTDSINDALSANGFSENFEDVFVHWMIASILNDRAKDVRDGYLNDGLKSIHVNPIVRTQLHTTRRVDVTATLKEWQPFWAQVDVSSGIALADSVFVRLSGPTGTWWRGAVVALYGNSSYTVTPIPEFDSTNTIVIPSHYNGVAISSIIPIITQTSDIQADGRVLISTPVIITASLDELTEAIPQPTPIQAYVPTDGDLIKRIGESEVYVVWGSYRRYLPKEVLKLYGFENRPVREVANDIFSRYTTSNYVRAIGEKKVYALWPDGTKHWIDITAAQWDASGRDWGAIFTVNDSEVAWYTTGKNVVQ